MTQVDLTIVVPAYNEERRLGPTLQSLIADLRARNLRWEIVVVDDGSRDRTAEVARSLGDSAVRVLRYTPNRGKGRAVRTGMLAGTGAVLGFMDADLSTGLAAMDRALAILEKGDADIVIGSRAAEGAKIVVRQPRYRQVASRIFNVIQRTLSGVRGYHDTQCGFKFLKANAAKDIFSRARIDGFMFDIELLVLADRLGYRVAEMPVTWTDDPASRLRIVRDTLRMFRDLVRIRWTALRVPKRARPTSIHP